MYSIFLSLSTQIDLFCVLQSFKPSFCVKNDDLIPVHDLKV